MHVSYAPIGPPARNGEDQKIRSVGQMETNTHRLTRKSIAFSMALQGNPRGLPDQCNNNADPQNHPVHGIGMAHTRGAKADFGDILLQSAMHHCTVPPSVLKLEFGRIGVVCACVLVPLQLNRSSQSRSGDVGPD